jgi:hypothetical protein
VGDKYRARTRPDCRDDAALSLEIGLQRGGRDRAEGRRNERIMGTEIKVPKIAGVLRFSVGRWFKIVGDPISIGEPLVEIDTYKSILIT